MDPKTGGQKSPVSVFKSDELKEAERLFEWALSYERKGLKLAAEALRDEGRKALDRFLSECVAS